MLVLAIMYYILLFIAIYFPHGFTDAPVLPGTVRTRERISFLIHKLTRTHLKEHEDPGWHATWLTREVCTQPLCPGTNSGRVAISTPFVHCPSHATADAFILRDLVTCSCTGSDE
ncbi:uncharacterized protein F5891DRAFT_207591 [Suillus fuscotomentosus]|uniref:Uncharacterized protein n=1 Tax=Suillus fuscotomentosus TaxID=1912939 RepID=A0AAD4EK73_9AGAM|nr:uncharacterized protein F5891DRAFT_207591 [Suillus fuscotomentosus]KAG1907640.1 hypothetical protein F5891DRAFT_207591 [Suillus fuscotomentosus]